jgi:hypothetical protein
VEEVHHSSSSTSVQKASAHVQNGANQHGPTSGTDHGWKGQDQGANGDEELADGHGWNVVSNGTSSIQRFWLRRFIFR